MWTTVITPSRKEHVECSPPYVITWGNIRIPGIAWEAICHPLWETIQLYLDNPIFLAYFFPRSVMGFYFWWRSCGLKKGNLCRGSRSESGALEKFSYRLGLVRVRVFKILQHFTNEFHLKSKPGFQKINTVSPIIDLFWDLIPSFKKYDQNAVWNMSPLLQYQQ